MSVGSAEKKPLYSAAKNDPEVLERRRQRIAALDAEIERMRKYNPGRPPSWDEQRIMTMDLAALQFGKRCIMWDDTGSGFFLMLNWDWLRNCPASAPSSKESYRPGWWAHAREILRPPLIDGSVPEHLLGDWLDKNTMRVHTRLLERLDKVLPSSYESSGWSYVLPEDDEYWHALQGLQTGSENDDVEV